MAAGASSGAPAPAAIAEVAVSSAESGAAIAAVDAALREYIHGGWPADAAAADAVRAAWTTVTTHIAAEDRVLDDAISRLTEAEAAKASTATATAALAASLSEHALAARLAAVEAVALTATRAVERLSSECVLLRRDCAELRSRLAKLEAPGASGSIRELVFRGSAAAAPSGRAAVESTWSDDEADKGEPAAGAGAGAGANPDAVELAAKVAAKPPRPVGGS